MSWFIVRSQRPKCRQTFLPKVTDRYYSRPLFQRTLTRLIFLSLISVTPSVMGCSQESGPVFMRGWRTVYSSQDIFNEAQVGHELERPQCQTNFDVSETTRPSATTGLFRKGPRFVVRLSCGYELRIRPARQPSLRPAAPRVVTGIALAPCSPSIASTRV